jgi:CheY-like chemotaxis protein
MDLSQSSNTPAHVLVAEDNRINQKIVKELLRKEGYTATVVANGKEALALLNEQSFQLLILDFNMPELNGLDTLKAIRSNPDKRINSIPVFLFTAEQDQQHIQDIQAYGIDFLLQKPINQAQLSQALKQTGHSRDETIAPTTKPSMEYLFSITGGNTELMTELIDIFIKEVPEAVMKIKDFYHNEQWASIKNLAHKLRPNYKYIGAAEVEELLKTLEIEPDSEQNQQQYGTAIHTLELITSHIIQELLKEKQKLS